MIRVNVAITNISAERFWDIRKPIPPIQIGTNINIIGMEKKSDGSVEVPFVLAINYKPSIAQISLKGTAYVSGDKKEIEKVAANTTTGKSFWLKTKRERLQLLALIDLLHPWNVGVENRRPPAFFEV
jgi:hypothetical protein